MNRSTPLARSRCGKRRYPSLTAAETALTKVRRDGLRDAAPVRAYDCGRCGGAHLTSQPKPAGRTAGARRSAGDPSAKTRGLVLARAGFACERCGVDLTSGGVHIHHRRLRSHGGGHDPVNLVALCPQDHIWVHAHRGEALAEGWIVASWADPATWPIDHHHHGLLLLTPDGGYTPVPRPGDPGHAEPLEPPGTPPSDPQPATDTERTAS